MPKVIMDYVKAMPLVAIGVSMLAGELVEPAKRIRGLFDSVRGYN